MTFNRLLRLMASSVGLRFAGAGIGFVTQFVLTRNFDQSEVADPYALLQTAEGRTGASSNHSHGRRAPAAARWSTMRRISSADAV